MPGSDFNAEYVAKPAHLLRVGPDYISTLSSVIVFGLATPMIRAEAAMTPPLLMRIGLLSFSLRSERTDPVFLPIGVNRSIVPELLPI